MVLLTLSKKLNQWIGPFMLKQGVKARYVLGRGAVHDNPMLDSALLLPLAQKLISLEVHYEIKQSVAKGKLETSWTDYFFKRKDVNTEDENPMDEATIRVKVLEKYVRKALIPNEKWSDVRKWQFHFRLIKWLRSEYLIARHGADLSIAMDAFPALRNSPQLQGVRKRHLSTLFSRGSLFDEPDSILRRLPSTELVLNAFFMQYWRAKKFSPATYFETERIASRIGGTIIALRDGSLRVVHASDDTDLSSLTLEEVIELVNGHVMQCGSFNTLCEEAGIFQMWTREYIERLGRYLASRTESFSGETVLMDVGAGDGLLAQALREYFSSGNMQNTEGKHKQRMASKSYTKQPIVVATDSGEWKIPRRAPVEILTVEEALRKYQRTPDRQVIVICSWMPMHVDWSNMFRRSLIDEYVLIGECDDGQCGDNWETWGNYSFREDIGSELDDMADDLSGEAKASRIFSDERASITIPYEKDGYVRKELKSLLPFQFSRFDCRSSKAGTTISFRRLSN